MTAEWIMKYLAFLVAAVRQQCIESLLALSSLPTVTFHLIETMLENRWKRRKNKAEELQRQQRQQGVDLEERAKSPDAGFRRTHARSASSASDVSMAASEDAPIDTPLVRSRSPQPASLGSQSMKSFIPLPAERSAVGKACKRRALASIRTIPEVIPGIPSARPPPLWPSSRAAVSSARSTSKVLALDMDSTLLFADRSERGFATKPSFSEVVATAHGAELYYVWVRPHLEAFLTTLSRLYNVVVFTASAPHYADALIDRIDPGGRLIKRRYYRQHCTALDSGEGSSREVSGDGGGTSSRAATTTQRYAKDLTILQVPLASVVLVDNDATSFVSNPDNALLVHSYVPPRGRFGTVVDNDDVLLGLLPILEALHTTADVRSVLRLQRRSQ